MKTIFKSLKSKLYISFGLVLIIPVVLVGVLSYLSAKDSIEKEILQSANQSVGVLNKLIDKTISEKINEIEVFSEEINSSMYGQGEVALRSSLQIYQLEKSICITIAMANRLFQRPPSKHVFLQFLWFINYTLCFYRSKCLNSKTFLFPT